MASARRPVYLIETYWADSRERPRLKWSERQRRGVQPEVTAVEYDGLEGSSQSTGVRPIYLSGVIMAC